MPTPDTFERTRVSVANYGVTITSWFDNGKNVWRANAPALQHLLGDQNEDACTGVTRERAISAITSRLTQQLTAQAARK